MVRIPLGGTEPPRGQILPAPPESQQGEFDDFDLICPITGEVVDKDDVDALISTYERSKRINDRCYAVMLEIRLLLAAKTEGDAKTRRVRGKTRAAKVEFPSDSWDQSLLKEAFHSFPQHRDSCLKIDSVGVQLREYKKLVNTSGTPDFNTFRDMVTKANRGQTGTPTVTVEA